MLSCANSGAAEGNRTLTVSLEATRGSFREFPPGPGQTDWPADSSPQYPSGSRLRAGHPAPFPSKIPNTQRTMWPSISYGVVARRSNRRRDMS